MNKPILSVVIASFNDADILNTVHSLHETAGEALCKWEMDVVVVDDASSRAVQLDGTRWPHAVVIRNARRIGCGPSRYVGAMAATGEFLLFCDAHSRFTPGWYEAAMERVAARPKTLHCGRCLGLGKTNAGVMNLDVNNPNAMYQGATWNFSGPYKSGPLKDNPRHGQVMECVWAPDKPGDDYELAAVMGAIYFINREWFIRLNALRHLRLWAGDEQELSLKVWLAGGEIRILKSVRVGHVFRTGNAPSGFVMPRDVLYNKMFISETCLPPEYARRLRPKFQREQQFNMASRALNEDWHLVETMRAYNSTIFERSFQSYLDQFNLSFPNA